MDNEIRIGVLKVTKKDARCWDVCERHATTDYRLGQIEFFEGAWYFMPAIGSRGFNQVAMLYIATALRMIEVG